MNKERKKERTEQRAISQNSGVLRAIIRSQAAAQELRQLRPLRGASQHPEGLLTRSLRGAGVPRLNLRLLLNSMKH